MGLNVFGLYPSDVVDALLFHPIQKLLHIGGHTVLCSL